MTQSPRVKVLQKFIPDSCEYDRMLAHRCEGIDVNESYQDFLDWNTRCILEYSDEDYIFFEMLCSKISINKISQMDMETCVQWNSSGIFFSKQKSLVIYHPR